MNWIQVTELVIRKIVELVFFATAIPGSIIVLTIAVKESRADG